MRSVKEVRGLVDAMRGAPRQDPKIVEEGYKGFNLVRYGDTFYALYAALGPVDLTLDENVTLKKYQEAGKCFISRTLWQLKESVDQRDIDGREARAG